MKLGIIGVGQAGGKIVDRFIQYEDETATSFIVDAVAINTARQDLHGLRRVPENARQLIGQSRVKGNGVGADNELGAEVAEEDSTEILNTVNKMATHEVDAFLVVAALGGGTGSGAGPVIAKHISEVYSEPVYGLGVLPASDEGSIYTLNAARSFKTFIDHVDNLLLFDNDAWVDGSAASVAESYAALNTKLVTRMGVLFNAGEIHDGHVGESVVDSSEIINTLNSGGIATVGYASEDLDIDNGLLSRFKRSPGPSTANNVNRITSLIRKASLGQLTLPCDLSSTERALVIIAGPTEYLNRKGIEKGRTWVEGETGSMEVRGGDYPLPGEDQLAALTLFSGMTDVPRIKELQKVAVEASDWQDDVNQGPDSLDTLVDNDGDDIDPLF